jgi:hypothetical protein
VKTRSRAAVGMVWPPSRPGRETETKKVPAKRWTFLGTSSVPSSRSNLPPQKSFSTDKQPASHERQFTPSATRVNYLENLILQIDSSRRSI